MRLTTYLLSRLLLSGILILIFAVGWLMYANHQQVLNELNKASGSMIRILELQSIGMRQGIGLEPRFPDWYPVTQVSLPSGACVRLLDARNEPVESTCRGRRNSVNPVPAWFRWLYQEIFNAGSRLIRKFDGRDQRYTLEILPDPDIEVITVWERTELAFLLTSTVVVALSLITAVLIHNAVKPVRLITESLSEIGKGSYEGLLTNFKFKEINQIATACNSLAKDLRIEKSKRDALFQRLQSAQEDERRTIALELHDDFGQHLTAINANALALQSASGLEQVNDDAERIKGSVQQLVDTVHRLLRRLRPYPEDGKSITEMVDAVIADFKRTHGDLTTIEVSTAGNLEDLPDEIAMVVFRVVQEALTNIKKHAKADLVNILLRATERALQIQIRDNGVASDLEQLTPGFGLTGMRERVATIGGNIELGINGAHGLCVDATLPLAEHRFVS